MSEKKSPYSDGIPEGSRIQELTNEIEQLLTSDVENLQKFLFKLFNECNKFVIENSKPIFFPQVELTLVYQTKLYTKMEKEKEKKAICREPAKGESTAFHVGNKFKGQIFVNVEKLLSLLSQYGYPTFILNFVITYFHEILHCYFLTLRTEQEILDVECILVEKFLGIKISEERKQMKSEDYYKKRNS